MDAICASRDMSTASFWRLDLREKSVLEGRGGERRKGTGTNRSAAGARDVVVLSREMYSVLRSHETFAATGGVPPA